MHRGQVVVKDSLYQVLCVSREASTSEIRKAYRKQALLNHPDKKPGDQEAAQQFLQVAEAYAILSDEKKRAQYDQGALEEHQDFDFAAASSLFNASLGNALLRQWRLGRTVSGILVENGKRVCITIHPDGSTEEREDSANGMLGDVFIGQTTLAGGGRMFNVSLRVAYGSLGRRLASLLVPRVIATQPVIGNLAVEAVAWLPTVLVGCLALRLLRPPRVPGALPDVLADAFRNVGPTGGALPVGIPSSS